MNVDNEEEPSWGPSRWPSWDGRINITKRIHLSLHLCWMSTGAVGLSVAAWVYRLWPFEGYWFNLNTDLGRAHCSIYFGE
jgi:hypothetical protein